MPSIVQEANVRTKSGANYSAAHTGPFSGLDQVKLEVPALGRKASGKLFVRDFLNATGMQISMNQLPPKAAIPFLHRHKQNEEVYIFISGKGQMQVDGDVIDVEEGSVIRVATKGSRCIRNTSTDPLHFICVQAKENSLEQETFEDGERDTATPVWPD